MIAQLALATALTTGHRHTHLWWDGRTCAAFSAWQHHPTAGLARKVYRDSRHADTYIRTDAAAWHLHPTRANAFYVHLDCTTPAD